MAGRDGTGPRKPVVRPRTGKLAPLWHGERLRAPTAGLALAFVDSTLLEG
jgi:hypothetical protein